MSYNTYGDRQDFPSMQIVTTIMLFTGILLFLSCQYSGPVEEALRQSGKNCSELERVLDFYRENMMMINLIYILPL
jgi:hypothetical protein